MDQSEPPSGQPESSSSGNHSNSSLDSDPENGGSQSGLGSQLEQAFQKLDQGGGQANGSPAAEGGSSAAGQEASNPESGNVLERLADQMIEIGTSLTKMSAVAVQGVANYVLHLRNQGETAGADHQAPSQEPPESLFVKWAEERNRKNRRAAQEAAAQRAKNQNNQQQGPPSPERRSANWEGKSNLKDRKVARPAKGMNKPEPKHLEQWHQTEGEQTPSTGEAYHPEQAPDRQNRPVPTSPDAVANDVNQTQPVTDTPEVSRPDHQTSPQTALQSEGRDVASIVATVLLVLGLAVALFLILISI